MENGTEKRVSLTVAEEIHQKHATIARLLGMSVKEATDQAISDWNKRKSRVAHKNAGQMLTPA